MLSLFRAIASTYTGVQAANFNFELPMSWPPNSAHGSDAVSCSLHIYIICNRSDTKRTVDMAGFMSVVLTAGMASA